MESREPGGAGARETLGPAPLENAASVGEVTCGVVHDLANILQSLLLRAELVQSSEDISTSHARNLEKIINDARDVAEIVRSLLERGRTSVDAMPPADLAAVAEEAVGGFSGSGEAGADRVRFTARASLLPVRCDPAELARGISLLAALMMRGADDSSTIEIDVDRAAEDEGAPSWLRSGGYAEVRLTRIGAGPGVPIEENIALTRGGVATLGADVVRVRGIVKLHRGVIRVDGGGGGRLEIVLAFPLVA